MKTAKMTIRLPGSELAFAKHYAKEQGMTLLSCGTSDGCPGNP